CAANAVRLPNAFGGLMTLFVPLFDLGQDSLRAGMGACCDGHRAIRAVAWRTLAPAADRAAYRNRPEEADMSIPVELPGLDEALGRYRFAYLLTSSAGAAPHAVAVVPVLEAGELRVVGLGRRSRRNLLAQPQVSLVWPPDSEDGYSLIVDGIAALEGEALRIRPSRAVLHRPAPRPGRVEECACGSACVELG